MSLPGPEDARREAQSLFDADAIPDPFVRKRGRLARPVPVLSPGGSEVGWFVPVAVGSKIAGFFQFDPQLRMLRWSAFPHRPDTTDEWPEVATWLDPDIIRGRAETKVPEGKAVGVPVLTFEQHVTRLAWVVPVRGPDGRIVQVHVAGEYAFLPASSVSGTG